MKRNVKNDMEDEKMIEDKRLKDMEADPVVSTAEAATVPEPEVSSAREPEPPADPATSRPETSPTPEPPADPSTTQPETSSPSPAVRNLAIKVEFDGTRYAGWQRQANALAVQERLEQALARALGHPVTLTGCSRTDAGVHARGHVSNFLTTNPIPADKLPLAVLSQLPHDIVLLDACEVPANFNARYAAVAKTYSYHIWNDRRPTAIHSRFTTHIPQALDVKAMAEAARHLVGRHDFMSFMAAGSTAKTTVREIYSASVTAAGPEVTILVEGNGFLYNMMRIISGTLVYVGMGKFAPADLPAIIQACNRKAAGKTLPPGGLFLERVTFDPPLFSEP